MVNRSRYLETRLARLRPFIHEDRRKLLGLCEEAFPGSVCSTRPPAEYLADAIDLCGYSLVERELSENVMAQCDFQIRQIAVSTRLPEMVHPNTNLAALKIFTTAHELGHVRLDHGEKVRLERGDATLPLFEEDMTPVVLRSYREEVRQKRPWPEIVREFEADLYAVEFLVPFDLLETRPEYRFIREAWEQGRDVRSGSLWTRTYALADWFRVSVTVMKKRLNEAGLVVVSEREMKIHPQRLLQPSN
jgi:Zn-dependent peptidase ImmA (M78 family)